MDVDAEMAAILQSSRFAEEFLIRAGGANAAALQGCCCKAVKVGRRQLCGWVKELGMGYQKGWYQWNDTKTPESFWAGQELMGHQEWCLVPESGQTVLLHNLEPSKGGSALTTPTCPWGLVRLTAGLP